MSHRTSSKSHLFKSKLPKTSGNKPQLNKSRRRSNTQIPASFPLPQMSPPSVSATIPTPPKWAEHYEEVQCSLETHKTFPLDVGSLEYNTIKELCSPLKVLEIEQIVNPKLWTRFVSTRKEQLRTKSADTELLTKIGLKEIDMLRAAQLSFNWRLNPALTDSPFSDNIALLFHCTRSAENLNTILIHGLDERVANSTRLGRGIYFSDNPMKSIQYDSTGLGVILVFAVLLGDCLSLDKVFGRHSLVREPEKKTEQKRNISDSFFDSAVARPGGRPYNKYVIYNRHQCVPLYRVTYHRGWRTKSSPTNHRTIQQMSIPPFAWIRQRNGQMAFPEPPIQGSPPWAFHAATIFAQMGVDLRQDENTTTLPVPQPVIEPPEESVLKQKKELVSTILNLGFSDEFQNHKVLAKCDLERAVNFLLENNHVQPSPSSSQNSSPGTSSDNPLPFGMVLQLEKIETAECPICCEEFPYKQNNDNVNLQSSWKILPCSHKLCISCHKRTQVTRATMVGVSHTHSKCPFCQMSTGIEIGTCPNGRMLVFKSRSTSCAGYEGVSTWVIRYSLKYGSTVRKEKTYFPDTTEGRRIVNLLKVAWDRRLIFSIGTSATSGQRNTLVWNIHHKTCPTGGVTSHGYPDPEYLDRVCAELKVYGIE